MTDVDLKPPATDAEPSPNRPESPEVRSNFLSRLFLLWVFPLVLRGFRKPLDDVDLWELRDEERGAYTSGHLINAWNALKEKSADGKGSLGRALYQNHVLALWVTGGLKLASVTLGVVQPVLIHELLTFLQTPGAPVGEGIGWAFSLLVAPLGIAVVEAQYFLRTMRGGMRIRSGIQGVLYDKSLNISPSARAESSVGEIVNLMQLDSQRLADFYQFAHVLWGAPLQLAVTVGLLFHYIGVSAVIGLVVTLLTVPLQGKLMAVQVRLRKATIQISDRRVKLMNEILQGIKGVKFYAWEPPFTVEVEKERSAEIKNYANTVWVRSIFMAIMMAIPIVIAVITFTFFAAVFKQDLDPARLFTGVALLNQLRTPVMMLPMTISTFIDARVALKRVERFLELEDTQDYARRDVKSIGDDSKTSEEETNSSDSLVPANGRSTEGGSINIIDGEFAWGTMSASAAEVGNEKKKGLFSRCLPKRKSKAGVSSDTDGENSGVEVPAEAPRPGEVVENEMAADEVAADEVAENEVVEEEKQISGSVLRNVSLSLKSGELTAVVGRVGSGKSSLVHAILGEMNKVNGEVTLRGSVAYVAQTAWIFNDTLRNNITFGRKFDERLYRRAVRVSALEPDIEVLPAGDMTAIGEKGINLSGGQKQRVSIARAVYADADVYLFDDPLSALDAHVSQSVFENCLSKRGVLRHKLRLLVTNQVHVLPECDQIIFLERGIATSVGSYNNLNADETLQRKLHLLVNSQLAAEEQQSADDQQTSQTVATSVDATSKHSASIAEQSMSKSVAAQNAASLSEGGQAKAISGKVLMQAEERQTGHIVLKAYYQYAKACGGIPMFSLMLVFWMMSVALSVIVQWWLVYWSSNTNKENPRLGFFIGIYGGLAIGYTIMSMLRSVWFLRLALHASQRLHKEMLQSVLRAPMSFFDTTPIGRIISRFSRDINGIDQLLPQNFQQMFTTVLNLLASYIYIGTALPIFYSVAVPVTIGYWVLQRFFNRSSLELKRLDSISKSPIYAHFSETLGGLSTLRAYGKQDESRADNMNMIDINQRAYFTWIAANRWFSLNLEILGSTLIFATAIFGVMARGDTFSGNIGLGLTYALQVTGILGFTVRSLTELESQMNSMERVNYYANHLPQEAPAQVDYDKTAPDSRPPEGWPAKGEIDIRDIELRYREGLDPVLKGVSVKISGGEMVGIVGRTGSGKSSLMIAILRMVELSGGAIYVDGVNLANLGLDEVRTKITIIPQDPVMFSGTVRFNLDPFGQYSEPELWDALAKSHLKEFVQDFEGGLDATVSEYGENLSAGQRQLICLTRALLRNSKILILDEASSSLDMETDRMIQETIRKYLNNSTILTIAHRLFTLADYDKVLVMNDGVMTEFDTPANLLRKPDSEFAALVDSMGEGGAERMRELVAKSGEV